MAILVIWKQICRRSQIWRKSGSGGEVGTAANGDNYGIFVGVFVLLLMAYDPISSFLFFLAVYMIHIMMYYFTRSYSKS